MRMRREDQRTPFPQYLLAYDGAATSRASLDARCLLPSAGPPRSAPCCLRPLQGSSGPASNRAPLGREAMLIPSRRPPLRPPNPAPPPRVSCGCRLPRVSPLPPAPSPASLPSARLPAQIPAYLPVQPPARLKVTPVGGMP
ncbi:hypothetical protein SETIT_5G050800v2 [Setaria italica]|uniref:Uncharacterized protein n=1 Tax=Setaria italica TaxID=4555 RepID=A0A368R1L2_SETIT|nr:hypothetical protein SETIT_5G050800v2 [Setaria italica]